MAEWAMAFGALRQLNVSRPVPVKSKSADPVSESIGRKNEGVPLRFSDFMDDGTEIKLEIRIDSDNYIQCVLDHQIFQELCTLVVCCNGRLQI
jgi:hypothetical protein